MADYTEQVKKLRERAECFDYDGRPDIACDYEQAADAIEQLNVPIAVRCYEDCYWVSWDEGDFYTPPSEECGKDDGRIFDLLNLDPCYDEDDEVDVPDCPFYLNRSKLEEMVGRYHYYEWDWEDGV